MSENAVAVIEPRGITSYSVNEVRAQIQQVQLLMKEAMQEGTHFGNSFPGDTKKNLLKPGADKLMFMFRLRPDFTQEIKELPGGHREIITRCMVYHIDSKNKIAEGVGSASTMESKYRYRNMSRKCPACGKETIIKGKEEYGGGWVCYKKKDGCGAKFNDNDPAIVNQQAGKIENPDIADCYNTVLKISKKRAYVDATITATAASDIFTQDLEDLTGKGGNEDGYENGNNERNVTPENLANKAMEEPLPPRYPTTMHPLVNDSGAAGETLQSVSDEIKAILTTKSPDSLHYFTEQEFKDAGAMVGGAKDLKSIKQLREFFIKKLEEKKAGYVPVPFGDDKVIAARVYENGDASVTRYLGDGHFVTDEFTNDIPEGMYEKPADTGEVDIF